MTPDQGQPQGQPDPDTPGGLDPERLLAMGAAGAGEVIQTGSPGATFTPPATADLATAFPDLEILGLLGQGGMGAVYKAVQKKLDRLVALKILPPEVAKDPSFAERFRREAKTLAQLNHPHIVTVHDFGQQGGYFYLLMEFVDGMNLRQMLQIGQLSPQEALDIVPQICDALQFAHDRGIVHRDIKPENILMDQRGQVHIADFGLAKIVGRPQQGFTLTQSHQVLGTPHYMAPEQVEQPTNVDHRADIFSLGVVFYEMLTGQLPLGRFEPPSAKAGVSPRFDPVVMRSLEQEPARRYQAASEVKSEVQALGPEAAAPAGRRPAAAAAAIAAAYSGQPPRLSKLALFGLLWLVIGFFSAPFGLYASLVDEPMHEMQASHRQAVRELEKQRAEWMRNRPSTTIEEEEAWQRRIEDAKKKAAKDEETEELPEEEEMLEEEEIPEEMSPSDYAKRIDRSLDSIRMFMMILLGLAALGVLAGPVMGGVAIGQIRYSAGQLYGMGLAVFTTFLLPLVGLNVLACMPLQFVRDGNVFGVALAVLLLVLAVLDIWFLVWFTRRMSAA